MSLHGGVKTLVEAVTPSPLLPIEPSSLALASVLAFVPCLF
jgi:hypothetical protein